MIESSLSALGVVRVLETTDSVFEDGRRSDVVLFSLAAMQSGMPFTLRSRRPWGGERAHRWLAAEWAPVIRVNAARHRSRVPPSFVRRCFLIR